MKTSVLSSTALVVLTSLALAAPALARPSMDDSAFISSAKSVSLSPDDRAVSRATGSVAADRIVSADDRALSRATVDVRSVDRIVSPDDRALPRGNAKPFVQSPITTESPGSFDWGDAGVGAATFALALLLVAGSAAGLRRTRQLGTT